MVLVGLPLLGLLFCVFSRFLGKQAGAFLSIFSVGLSFLVAVINANDIFLNGETKIVHFGWSQFLNFNVQFSFLLDPLSITMSLLITGICTLVMLFSYSYLNQDPHLIRFLSFLSFFCGSMLLLVTAGNYLQLFVGWEAVGLSSFLLISFWITKNSANQGGLKAVLVNRVGDVFFLLALVLLWQNVRSFEFSHVFLLFLDLKNPVFFNISCGTLLAFFLFVAASAKSAQLLFHTWLVDAMEGPTPVSSLLHSATMVTAGVFLIIRSSHIFSHTPNLNILMMILGLSTALVSGYIGMNQTDLKKIIAFSTCSQLGFMFIALGLGAYILALYHLVLHAFFKCNLFLCSGSLIHSLSDEQDIRRAGNLAVFMPVTFISMLISSLSLAGFPFLSGFFSKDLILEALLVGPDLHFAFFFMASFAAYLTSFYSLRAIIFVFFGSPAFEKTKLVHIEEAPALMMIPIVILTILSIVLGKLTLPFFTGPISLFVWKNSIYTPILSPLTEPEYLGAIKMLPLVFSGSGVVCSIFLYFSGQFFVFFLRTYGFLNLTMQKFYFDSIYNFLLASPALSFGLVQYKVVDRGLLELFGPTGISRTIQSISKMFSSLHSGFLHHYLTIIFLSGLLILGNLFYFQLSSSLIGIFCLLFILSNTKNY